MTLQAAGLCWVCGSYDHRVASRIRAAFNAAHPAPSVVFFEPDADPVSVDLAMFEARIVGSIADAFGMPVEFLIRPEGLEQEARPSRPPRRNKSDRKRNRSTRWHGAPHL